MSDVLTRPDANRKPAAKLVAPASDFTVDLKEVAEKHGLAIFSTDLPPGVSGMLCKRPELGTKSGFVIFTKASEPAVRQRFTAAHEIGHFVLHKHLIGDGVEDNYLLRSDRLSSRVEVEANKFAARLLMPMNQVDRAMRQGIRSPKDLAKAFGVSEVAMAIQLGLPT
ncbi:ImmA/IrrE family metallo-endopeptidase [Paracoccus sediminilitoris]|uniref:ImmA/IrrE family metallo-endopeptidase n=1 Tax=Paracoccus sediminilitoris TaxID=2202419 RepID=UPI00272A86A4|nr:ImmA/IrrE family metallo-endopeptidase [Paracoccus sediminilitoris]